MGALTLALDVGVMSKLSVFTQTVTLCSQTVWHYNVRDIQISTIVVSIKNSFKTPQIRMLPTFYEIH